MESIMLTIKFVVLYVSEVFVVAVVGAVVIAALVQSVRDRVAKRRVSAPAAV